ncbi:small ribosomal subunit protein mS37 [Cynoglossus semilaevis]|uniref:Coiled-coil-helix-coiled-coil-helix domain containing 1 n=1 Tax=Cynoglossus semilaevis TaxID=244447 RepID=A0A3P8UQE3_CYNSE|nr:coiled-coil-helix-coiled-coil-helix domain-containing protein 1 [Cynoglossus semilaevis]
MASNVGIEFLEKVSRLLSRQNKKPVLKPNRPLVLKDAVANRKLQKGEASCITEMSVLMACWKQNNFVDGLCTNEINTFYSCVKKAQTAAKNNSAENMGEEGRLHPQHATTLLRRHPNIRTEI